MIRSPRFYYPSILKEKQNVLLPEHIGRHIKVLRLQQGDQICLFNGKGGEYSARITQIKKNMVEVATENYYVINRENKLKIHLLQSLVQKEKMDLIVQKTTELGITSITPLLSERSQYGRNKTASWKQAKLQRWEKIAIHACEQCGLNRVPRIHPISDWPQHVEELSSPVIYLSPEATKTLDVAKHLLKQDAISLLVGPEGGWSELELQQFNDNKYIGVSLGERVLRAETASILAVGLLGFAS